LAPDGVTGNREAPAPQNVRAVMPCGEVIPLELICIGHRRGKWRWVGAWRLRVQPAQVHWDFLPEDVTILVNAVPAHGA
jgi:hypothetical protein